MANFNHQRQAEEQASRAWDAVARGETPAASDLDATLVETIRRLQVLGDHPHPDSTFASRLEAELMQTLAATLNTPLKPLRSLTSVPNGRAAPIAAPRPARWHEPSRSRWALVQLATAALVLLTLVGSYVAFEGLRHQRHQQQPAFVPALVGTPESTPEVAIPVVKQIWDTTGGPDTPLDAPFGMAVDPQGNLWVADTKNARIQIFAPNGTFRETWGTAGSGEGQFNFHPYDEFSGMPGGYGDVTFDRQGNIYVADTGNFRIQKFAPDRTFIRQWGSKGTAAGQFLDIFSVAVGPDGNIYVVDENRHDVQRFDADGQFLNTIGEAGTGDGQLSDAQGAAIDAAGNVWVTDYDLGHIQRYSPDGQFLGTWGHRGFDEGDLYQPVDLAFDSSGRVWVVDLGRGVQVFAPDGRFLTAVNRQRTATSAGVLSSTIGIAMSGDGQVYISEWSGDRVTAFRILAPGTAATPTALPATSAAVSSPGLPPVASPAALNPELPRDHILLQSTFDTLPDQAAWVGVERTTLQPGATWDFNKTGKPSNGPRLFLIEAGALAVTADGPLQVERAGSATPIAASPGVELTLHEGDRGITESGTAVRWRNTGDAPTQVLDAWIDTLGIPTLPDGVSQEDLVSRWPIDSLTAPVLLTVQEINLAPGDHLIPATIPGLQGFAVASGTLHVHDSGEGGTPPGDFTMPAGASRVFGGPGYREAPRSWTVSSADSNPVTLIILTMPPASPLEEGTPMG